MKRIIFGLALLLSLISAREARAQSTGCANATIITGMTTTNVQIVAANASNLRVGICGWILSAVAAATFALNTGTGTNCGTGNAALVPNMSLPATTVNVNDNPRVIITGPAGAAVCGVSSSGAMSGILYWGYF